MDCLSKLTGVEINSLFEKIDLLKKVISKRIQIVNKINQLPPNDSVYSLSDRLSSMNEVNLRN